MRPAAVLRALSLSTLAVLTLGVASARAHPILVSSDPADGSTLDRSPGQIHLVFSEPLVVGPTVLELLDSAGRPVAIDMPRLDSGDERQLVVTVPALRPDAYRLRWQAISSDDAHVTSGSLVFGIQVVPPVNELQAAEPSADQGEGVLRWLELAGLAAVMGALIVGSFSSNRRLSRLAAIGAVVALGAEIATVVLLVSTTGWTSTGAQLAALAATRFVPLLLGRAIVVTILLVVVLGMLRMGTGRRLRALAALLLVGVVVLRASTSHLAVRDGLAGLIVISGHLLAALVWIGGVMALLVAIWPLLRRRDDESALVARHALRSFSPYAVIGLCVLAISGLVATSRLVATPDALLLSSYGHVLVMKIGLGVGVALLGLRHASLAHATPGRLWSRAARILARRRDGPAVPRAPRTLVLEAAGGLALLSLAALLAATPPARGPLWDVSSDRPDGSAELAARVDDLLLTLSLAPGRPGPNLITIGAFDTRRPPPAPIERVSVALTSPGGAVGPSIEASPLGDGRYSVASDLASTPGEWGVAVTVDRLGLPVASLAAAWSILPALSPADLRPELVSKRPLEPILTWAAALAAVVFTGLLALAVLVRWRSTIIAGVGAPGADVRSGKARFATVRGGPR